MKQGPGWPRKNATTLIVNFKDIINATELIFNSLCGKFIFQQNDTIIINFGYSLDPSAILVRQCHFQNLVLFRPHRTLEHGKIPTSRRPVALTEPLLWKRRQTKAIHYATADSPGRREAKNSCCSKDRSCRKSSKLGKRHCPAKIALVSKCLTQNYWSWCHFVGKWIFYQVKKTSVLLTMSLKLIIKVVAFFLGHPV